MTVETLLKGSELANSIGKMEKRYESLKKAFDLLNECKDIPVPVKDQITNITVWFDVDDLKLFYSEQLLGLQIDLNSKKEEFEKL